MGLPAPIVIKVERHIPRLNKTRNEHWSRRARRVKNLCGEVRRLTLRKMPPAPFSKAHLLIERHAMGVEMDFDNLVATYKELIDALKPSAIITGFILDDSQGCIKADYRTIKVSKPNQQCTVVTITALEL